MCLAGLSAEFIDKFPEDRASYMPDVEDAMRRVGIHFDSERGILMEVGATVLCTCCAVRVLCACRAVRVLCRQLTCFLPPPSS